MTYFYYLVKKDFKDFFRYKTWIVSVIIWPILIIFGQVMTSVSFVGKEGQGLQAFVNKTGTNDIVLYVLIGTLMWYLFQSILWSTANFLRDEKQLGTIEVNWVSPIPRIYFVLGKAVSGMFISSIWLIPILIFSYFLLGSEKIKLIDLVYLLLLYLLGTCVLILMGITFGTTVFYFLDSSAFIQMIRPIFALLAGISFPITVLPEFVQIMSKINPLWFLIEGTRSVFIDNSIVNIRYFLGMLIIQLIFFLILSAVLYRVSIDYARKRGSLNYF